jgi:hypothetical protein
MSRRWAGASGRYQAICEQGHCALTGGEATSKHEGQIFALLNYVIGPGQHDLRATTGSRVVRIDMTFPLPFRRTLAVEYDGAYWHQGQEERDLCKADMILRAGRYFVVRSREDPLRPLTPLDVHVPPRADAAECVRLTLLQLAHELNTDVGQDALWRIGDFLHASAQPRESGRIACKICRRVAQHGGATAGCEMAARIRAGQPESCADSAPDDKSNHPGKHGQAPRRGQAKPHAERKL